MTVYTPTRLQYFNRYFLIVFAEWLPVYQHIGSYFLPPLNPFRPLCRLGMLLFSEKSNQKTRRLDISHNASASTCTLQNLLGDFLRTTTGRCEQHSLLDPIALLPV